MALSAIFFVSACTCGEPRTDIPELQVPRVTTAITIDGDLSEWDEVNHCGVLIGVRRAVLPRTKGPIAWG